jgi:hypothetical protein
MIIPSTMTRIFIVFIIAKLPRSGWSLFDRAFLAQDRHLLFDAPGVAAHAPVGADYAMTRHFFAVGIFAQRSSDRTIGSRISCAPRHLLIRQRFPTRDLLNDRINTLGE